MADENQAVRKNKIIFAGVGAVLGGLTGAAVGGALVALLGAGIGGALGYNALKRI